MIVGTVGRADKLLQAPHVGHAIRPAIYYVSQIRLGVHRPGETPKFALSWMRIRATLVICAYTLSDAGQNSVFLPHFMALGGPFPG